MSRGSRRARRQAEMKPLYLAAGIVSVALGAVGAALPIMPTVPFLLLAVYCFARSNPAGGHRILHHPYSGPPVAAWRERRVLAHPTQLSPITALAARPT